MVMAHFAERELETPLNMGFFVSGFLARFGSSVSYKCLFYLSVSIDFRMQPRP